MLAAKPSDAGSHADSASGDGSRLPPSEPGAVLRFPEKRGSRPVTKVNRKVILASRPKGYPRVSDFQLVYSPLPTPAAGEVLVRAIYLSLDPFVRAMMSTTSTASWQLGIGDVLTGGAVAVVVESHDPDFAVGDAVEGMLGWQEYAVRAGRELRKIDPALAPVSTALGILGTPGLTAFFGLLDICDPQRGETVVVSGAAGAIGMLVGQIAAIQGCRVVGVAAGTARISWLVDDLGFDAALNYTTESELDERLAELCPDGIDVYFDNDGGAITDGVVKRLNSRARIALCGQSSLCNLEQPEVGAPLAGPVDRQAGEGAGLPRGRFLRALSRSVRAAGSLASRGKDQVPRGSRPRPRGGAAGLHRHAAGKERRETARAPLGLLTGHAACSSGS